MAACQQAQNANLHAPARACALPPPRPGSVPFEFLAVAVADRTCFCVFPTPGLGAATQGMQQPCKHGQSIPVGGGGGG